MRTPVASHKRNAMFTVCMVVGAEQEDDSLAIFGKGFYFSKRADKAHYYTQGGGKLLVATVAMGSCTTVITPDRARTAPPPAVISATSDATGNQVEQGEAMLHSILVPGRPRYSPKSSFKSASCVVSCACPCSVRLVIKHRMPIV